MAVTKSGRELEQTVGVQLFERRFKCVALAQDGNRFSASARNVVAAIAEAARVDAGVAPKSGAVREWALVLILALILALIWVLIWVLNLTLISCGCPIFRTTLGR